MFTVKNHGKSNKVAATKIEIKKNQVFYLYQYEDYAKKVGDNLYIVAAGWNGYDWIRLDEGSYFTFRKGEKNGYEIVGTYKRGYAEPVYDRFGEIVKVCVGHSKYGVESIVKAA